MGRLANIPEENVSYRGVFPQGRVFLNEVSDPIKTVQAERPREGAGTRRQ